MRLDKFISMNGMGSRKEARGLIKSKKVLVNDTIITDSGKIIDPDVDRILVDGTPIIFTSLVYLMLNKPQGYICEHQPVEYPSVLELLDTKRNDLFFVGRLDADTEGLLLITNDGQFSHQVAHGKKDISKTYEVHLKVPFEEKYISLLEEGITLDDGPIKPATVRVLQNDLIHLTISEGKYHQVKRMMHYCDNEVVFLKRLSIGTLELDPTLSLGQSRPLTTAEIHQLIPNYEGSK